MARWVLQDATLDLGHGKLLDGASLTVEPGERIALIGRNGAGKSTLLRVLAGEIALEAGCVDRPPGGRVAWLPQEVPVELAGSVFDRVADGLGALGRDCARERALLADPTHDPHALAEVHQRIDTAGGWDAAARVERAIEAAGLDADAEVQTLSGGQKRRVLLARAILEGASLLLLDEPTNHLDVPSIEALEALLRNDALTVIFVSHDRAFVDAVATRIVELDRGTLTSYPKGWERFLELREARFEEEARHQALFDKKLAEEEAWIRRGVQARRTRDMGRVARLEALRRERGERRERAGKARMEIVEADRSGRLVVEAEGMSFAWVDPQTDERTPIVEKLDLVLMRGERLAVMGPNGSGKTTLLELLFGERRPTGGSVRQGTNLQVARFDQLRTSLDPDRTVMDTVADGADRLTVGGRNRHVAGYLRDFLFEPSRLRSRVRTLSGGERNRLLLARLFTRPANLLILDEPTNDLDLETLELLETLVTEFEGTVVVVSHDRAFVDRVATSTLYLPGDGTAVEYAGGYTDAMAQRARSTDTAKAVRGSAAPKASPAPAPAPAAKAAPSVPASGGARRLSSWEARELEELPARIEALEAQVAETEQLLLAPSVWEDGGARGVALQSDAARLRGQLDEAYARWELLETRREAGG